MFICMFISVEKASHLQIQIPYKLYSSSLRDVEYKGPPSPSPPPPPPIKLKGFLLKNKKQRRNKDQLFK